MKTEQEIVDIVKRFSRYYSNLYHMIDVESLCYDTMVTVLNKYNPNYKCKLENFYLKSLSWAIKNEIRLKYKQQVKLEIKFSEAVNNNQVDYLSNKYDTLEQNYEQKERYVTLELVIKNNSCGVNHYDIMTVLLGQHNTTCLFPNDSKQNRSVKFNKIKKQIKKEIKKRYKWLIKN